MNDQSIHNSDFILKGNILIFSVMNKKPYEHQGKYYLSNTPYWSVSEDTKEMAYLSAAKCARYAISYDALMPVVEKIESLNNGGFDVSISTNGTVITKYRSEEKGQLHQGVELIRCTSNEVSFNSKIDHIYQAVVEFLTVYNKKYI